MRFGKRMRAALKRAVDFYNLRLPHKTGAEREEATHLTLAQYIRLNATPGESYRQSAAYFRRVWRRARPQGMKPQRPNTDSTNSKAALRMFSNAGLPGESA
jgi:hypothetical protein